MVGLLYLAFFVFLCVLSAQGVITNDECEGGIFLEILVAWVDCYFIYKGIQKDNWQKLQMLLLSQKSQNQPAQSANNQAQKAEFAPSAQPNPIPLYQMSGAKSSNNALLIFALVAVLIIVVAYVGFKPDPKEQVLEEFKSTLDVLEGMGKELQKRYGDK